MQIDTLYDQVTDALPSYAKVSDPAEVSSLEQAYEKLHYVKEHLIYFAQSLDIKTLADLKNYLNFWKKNAITEQEGDEISDRLFLSIYEFCQKARSLECVIGKGGSNFQPLPLALS